MTVPSYDAMIALFTSNQYDTTFVPFLFSSSSSKISVMNKLQSIDASNLNMSRPKPRPTKTIPLK